MYYNEIRDEEMNNKWFSVIGFNVIEETSENNGLLDGKQKSPNRPEKCGMCYIVVVSLFLHIRQFINVSCK